MVADQMSASYGEDMCGRFSTGKRDARKLSKDFAAVDFTEGAAPPPSYNVAPTNTILIVRESERTGERQRVITPARWGLVPSWAKDIKIGSKLFNARSESVADKPAFKRAFVKRRCLIPAEGWYEWQKQDPKNKQVFYMTRADGTPIAFAGLWEAWRDPAKDGEWLISATILTGPAGGPFADIHNRMPVVVDQEHWGEWLGEEASTDDAADLLKDLRSSGHARTLAEEMELRPVGKEVGNVANNGPSLIEPINPA